MKELFENGDMSVDKIPDFCKGYLVEGKPAREYFNHLQLLSAKAKQRKASRLLRKKPTQLYYEDYDWFHLYRTGNSLFLS